MAEQQRTRSAKQTAEGVGTASASATASTATAVAGMSTPIFDELLREMAAAQHGQAKATDRHSPAAESKHRAP
ncbi:hypothetical protein [Labedaea rhizosphaerae]|uniref:Uncharacterized protein n=1 Tax=Labedaea rhizosphaerae TaxID=598644 RepID=A0A4R6RXZ1_LABRH|nr:hypothetical protein [Labedaea rhizosphaerae]TDP91951.1 hypothetical protein EV186_108162 [Labedaea rhizosphaerae]